ncbi:low-specificity L-threonine aldolase [Paraferrimonas sp. SM1919]|uniref:low-specificity L-threonine aldolase n=1 Tax=Paraferrimonas sp. SM1919 TaxID=2662263 RepID=UPI0013D1316F|nr:low-specificity L-threonine aldolase [Paraferrimonas sp. SM1919]
MIDLRSDTVTLPTPQMLEAMNSAPVGDDVFGDDPSINKLEQYAAERFGFDEALFTSSGTQANLLAILGHCGRGDEYLCGQDAHNYKYEAGGAAVLGSVQPQPIANAADGSIDLELAKKYIKPDDYHFARTRLLSIENTIGGKVLSMDYMAKAQAFAFNNNLKIHLDGARMMNAAVALAVKPEQITQFFDSVSICLSKGLAAPVGSLLLGDSAFIARARRLRKMVGGGMRQAGSLAAAGQVALESMIERLADDHANAKYLGEQLNTLEEVSCNLDDIETNMVFAEFGPRINPDIITAALLERDIKVLSGNPMRLVLHKDISKQDIDSFIKELSQILDI